MGKEIIIKGLHVLVEKSMACNFRDVNYLNDLAQEKLNTYRKFSISDFMNKLIP